MFRNFYRILITSKLSRIDLFDYLELAKRYGKVALENKKDHFIKSEENPGFYNIPESSEPFFIEVGGEFETHCAFYENLFFHFSYDPALNDTIVRVYVKRPSDKWEFKALDTLDGGCDVLNPTNVHAEVYIKYNVSVLKKSNRCTGEDYKTGNWNKAFWRSLISFFDTVQNFTELNRIKLAYEK
jgi:hypothetical protein